MKLPGINSVVALQAIAPTSACVAKNASLSFAAAALCTVQTASSPLTTSGLSGPSRIISGLAVLTSSLYQHAHRQFDQDLDGRQQFRAQRAIEHAMVAGQRQAQHADKGNATVGLLDRLPPRRADRENGRVRRIDDGGEFADAMHAEIGNRRRAALVVGRFQLLLAGAARKRLHLGPYRG